MDELGVWEGLAGGPGIEHSHATARGTPEEAVTAALARARWKYGRSDFAGWRLRAELQTMPASQETVWFEWRGRLVRLADPDFKACPPNKGEGTGTSPVSATGG